MFVNELDLFFTLIRFLIEIKICIKITREVLTQNYDNYKKFQFFPKTHRCCENSFWFLSLLLLFDGKYLLVIESCKSRATSMSRHSWSLFIVCYRDASRARTHAHTHTLTRWVNSFTPTRTCISHFRRPLIEDRCTSRGSAVRGDEGIVAFTMTPARESTMAHRLSRTLGADPKITRLWQRAMFALPQIRHKCAKKKHRLYNNSIHACRS